MSVQIPISICGKHATGEQAGRTDNALVVGRADQRDEVEKRKDDDGVGGDAVVELHRRHVLEEVEIPGRTA